MRLLVT